MAVCRSVSLLIERVWFPSYIWIKGELAPFHLSAPDRVPIKQSTPDICPITPITQTTHPSFLHYSYIFLNRSSTTWRFFNISPKKKFNYIIIPSEKPTKEDLISCCSMDVFVWVVQSHVRPLGLGLVAPWFSVADLDLQIRV